MPDFVQGLSPQSACIKRSFDFSVAFVGLALTWWLILLAAVAARLDTGQSGFFVQERVGRYGRRFRVIKLRTMRPVDGIETSVTTESDPRITRIGRLLRRTKLDELPQLVNVLRGEMSFVGPRPDVPGFADQLEGPDKVVLTVRPGITGPATLKYRNEEAFLRDCEEPERYNREVIFPDKVKINREYIENYSFCDDIRYIWQTLVD